MGPRDFAPFPLPLPVSELMRQQRKMGRWENIDTTGHRTILTPFLPAGDEGHETNVSAAPEKAAAKTRIPGSHGNSGRPQGFIQSPRQGPGQHQYLTAGRFMSSVRPDQGLARFQRLTRPAQFRVVYEKGRKVVGRGLILWVLPAEKSGIRLGVVASRRVGGSVQRNRARRLLREAFRLHRFEMRGPADVVLIARGSILGSGRKEVEADLLNALHKIGLAGTKPGDETGS
jgi:ribonuclease P protein component